MATLRIQDTAYPRLKSTVTTLDLDECYTPTTDELWLAHRLTRSSLTAIGFLMTLKTVQRLGYFVPITEVPNATVQHIAAQVQGTPLTPDDLDQYQQSNTMDRHRQAIRDHLSLISPGRATRRVMVQVMGFL